MLKIRTDGGVPRWLNAPVRRVARGLPLLRRLVTPAGAFADGYEAWARQEDSALQDASAAIRARIAGMRQRPLISVVMPVFDPPEPLLRVAIASVRAQWWPDWELCIADDASRAPHVARVLAECAAEDRRIRWVRRDANGHIAAASNSALALARGEWVALLDHDDMLPPHALHAVAEAAMASPQAAVLFSDEDKIDGTGRRFDPYFKPGFDPDLLLGHNMFNHLSVYRRDLLLQLGGWREGFDGSQDYDLALRAVAATDAAAVLHLPGVLYHWRQRAAGRASFSERAIGRCVAHARQAIADHLVAAGHAGARVEPAPSMPFWNRIRWPLPDPAPAASLVLVGADDPAPTLGCIDRLLARSALRPAEILVPLARDTLPDRTARPGLRLVACGAGSNWADAVNAAARQASGEVLVLLGPQPDPADPDWLGELVAQALRPGIGAAGGLLLGRDGRVRHAELALGGEAVAERAYQGHPADRPGIFGALALARRVGALGGGCLAIRRDLFLWLGGADTALGGDLAAVDLSLRIRAAGRALIWTPFARITERSPVAGAAAPGQDEAGARRLRQRWGALLTKDPARNPLLALVHGRPALAAVPAPAAMHLPARDATWAEA